MRLPFLIATVVALLLVGSSWAEESTAGKHALLIGCTAYPNLTERYQLKGPVNDVELTGGLLIERFGFSEDQIVRMTHDNEESMRPKRANIVREFENLVARAGDGDTVFILLAGHGGREPDDGDDEDDGWDEVFHPEDITTWHSKGPEVKGIADDQIRIWFDAIRDKGAFVFLMADTCHSGTMDRGPADDAGLIRYRSVEPEVTTSPDVIERIAERVTELGKPLADGELPKGDLAESGDDAKRGGLVALYAVPSNATEAEQPMPPPGSPNDKHYGRLTFTVNQILRRAVRPITYRELAQQMGWWYEQWQLYPVGFVNGPDLDREVLGQKVWPERSTVLLNKAEDDSLSLNVGSLQGVTVDSIFALHPVSGEAQGDQPAGYVRVVEVSPVDARVEPCEYDGAAALPVEKILSPARCELAFEAMDLKLAVGISPFDPKQQDADSLAKVRSAVDQVAAQDGSLVRLAGSDENAEVYALVAEDGVYFRRPHDVIRQVAGNRATAVPTTEQTAPPLFGPIKHDNELQDRLERSLTTMARAMNLRKLVGADEELRAGEPRDPNVGLDIEVKKWNPKTRAFETEFDPSKLVLYDRDKVRVEVTNVGSVPVDITILYVESAYRIISYLPTLRDAMSGYYNNRLEPDGKPKIAQFTINDSTVGMEDVIVIGVVGDPALPPQNFAFLQQEGLEQARAAEVRTRGPGKSPLQTPLGELVGSAMYGDGTRGGSSESEMTGYAVRRISWLVEKGKSAKTTDDDKKQR